MKKLIIIFAVIFFSQNLNAQSNFSSKKVDELLSSAIQKFNIPGITVGIIKDNDVIYSKGVGLLEVGNDDKITDNSLFAIASCSKAFTAASIGILVDRGLIDWKDRVTDYLPGFKLHDLYITNELRIEDLLCHRTGFNTFDGDLLWYGSDYSRKEVVKRIANLPIKNSFRSKYGYSNVMFITAGEVIEAVSGMSWNEFVKKNILLPLNMQNTVTSITEFSNKYEIAKPHIKKNPIDIMNYDNLGPAGAINTCASDMMQWLKMWLNKGIYNGDTLLSEKSYYKITSSHTVLNGGKGEVVGGKHFSNAALGWFLNDYEGRKIIGHGGSLPGYLTRVLFIPEESLGIFVSVNDNVNLSSAVSNQLIDMMLGLNKKNYIEEYYNRTQKKSSKESERISKLISERIKNTTPSLALKEYSGTYEDTYYGLAEVKIVNEELYLSLLPSKKILKGKLEHWHFDTFKIKFLDPFLPMGLVTFSIGNKPSVEGFKIDLPNWDFHFYNLDFKKK